MATIYSGYCNLERGIGIEKSSQVGTLVLLLYYLGIPVEFIRYIDEPLHSALKDGA